MRNAVGNQLHALAMGEGACRKKQLWTKKGRAELESLGLGETVNELCLFGWYSASLCLTGVVPVVRFVSRFSSPRGKTAGVLRQPQEWLDLQTSQLDRMLLVHR